MPFQSFAPFLTCLILISTLLFLSSPLDNGHYAEEQEPKTSHGPFRSFFSVNGPDSLFAPAAIISLTDDNSTFFNARPAAFGPQIPIPGLSGPVWAGHSFPEEDYSSGGVVSADSGELGCGDIPGWAESHYSSRPGSGGTRQASPSSEEQQDDTTNDPDSSDSYMGQIPWRDSTYRSPNLTDHIALLSRGDCGFLHKVLWAQRRGATAVIVGDNLNGGPLVTMYAKGDTSNVSIPSVFTSHMTAHLLASLVPHTSATSATSDSTSTALHGGDSDDRPYHEALWVTLSLTTPNTNPFFNTLFVLVVSPLVTLAIVYAMLLIRARIRRRRWRAPKSVVDRLPVRVYHTTTSRPSPESTAEHPGTPSVNTPLLSGQRTPQPIPGQETRAGGGAGGNAESVPSSSYGSIQPSSPEEEKKVPRPKKYQAKQIECAVCLDEYEDGISRVMSLPCGHDFHADCVTPWLTTRRRTCPICKTDVVRSLGEEDGRASPGELEEGTREERIGLMAQDVQDEAVMRRNDDEGSRLPLVLRREEERREEIEALDLEREAEVRLGRVRSG